MASCNNFDLNNQQSKVVVIVDPDSNKSLEKLFSPNRPLQKPYWTNFPISFTQPPLTGTKSPSVSHSCENSADSAFGSGSNDMDATGPSIINRLLVSNSQAHRTPATFEPTNDMDESIINRLLFSNSRAHRIPATLEQTNDMDVPGPSIINRLLFSNSRAHSSPATLEQTYAVLNSENVTTNNVQQQVQDDHMKQRSYNVISNIQLQEQYGDLPSGWEQAKTQEGQIYYLKYVLFYLFVVFVIG